jgi:uncharacterized phiE125 gp8 family phage protein
VTETVLVTAAVEEPVTLAEAKTQCRIDDTVDDTAVLAWTIAAREYVEQVCSRALISSTWDYFLSDWPCDSEICLPLGNVSAIASVKYYDTDDTEHTMLTSDYYAILGDRGRVALKYNRTWPSATVRPARGVVVRYTAGWANAAAVPGSVKSAIKLLVAHWYANREAVVLGNTASAQGVPLPMGVDSLLANYRLY